MTLSTVPEWKGSTTPTVFWGGAYFFSVAILYLWGYWSPFGINVLEYASVSDIVKTAAYPVASVFVFTAVGVLFGRFVFPEGFLPAGGGAETPAGRWLVRVAPVIVTIYLSGIGLLFAFGPLEKWLVLPVLLAIPASIGIEKTGALRTLVKSDRERGVALFLLATLPPFAYGHAVLRANDVISGKTYSYVLSEMAGKSFAADVKNDVRLRYLGRVGEQYFLYSPKSLSVLVLQTTEAKVLEIKLENGKPVETSASVVSPAAARPSSPPIGN